MASISISNINNIGWMKIFESMGNGALLFFAHWINGDPIDSPIYS